MQSPSAGVQSCLSQGHREQARQTDPGAPTTCSPAGIHIPISSSASPCITGKTPKFKMVTWGSQAHMGSIKNGMKRWPVGPNSNTPKSEF